MKLSILVKNQLMFVETSHRYSRANLQTKVFYEMFFHFHCTAKCVYIQQRVFANLLFYYSVLIVLLTNK